MPRDIPLFRKGEKLSASKLNVLVEELRRLQNVKGGEGVKVVHTKNGIIISRQRRILTVDDRYRLDVRRLNSSDLIRRLGDLHEGDIADFLRVRATLEDDPNPDITHALYRAMLLLDRSFGGGTHGGEGGYVTDAARIGLDKIEYFDEHKIPTPIARIGQLGAVLVLDNDDLLGVTEDGDRFVYLNIRQDAHFLMSERDGRIYFTQNSPGSRPNGLKIIGEMVLDPAKANDPLSELGKESGEWCPQYEQPGAEFIITGEIYESPDTANYQFPTLVVVPNSTVQAYEFGTVGRDEGWSAHYQLQNVIDSYGVGFLIKYSAENVAEVQQDAFMELEFKVINDGGDMSTAVVTSAPFTLPVPAASVEQTLQYAYMGFAWNGLLSDKCLIIVKIFARDAGHASDTLAGRLLIVETVPMLMTVAVPP